MSMEHRLKKRCQLSLDVTVRGHNGLSLAGRTRDISPDGMFVELAWRAVSANNVVEIEIPSYGNLHGWVVHVGDKGIGVMFRSIDSREERFLGRLLSGKFAA